MDQLDVAITLMVAADLSDCQILNLVPVRMRYRNEPTWPLPDPLRLEFARQLAETGRIGRMDRYPGLTTIRMIDTSVNPPDGNPDDSDNVIDYGG